MMNRIFVDSVLKVFIFVIFTVLGHQCRPGQQICRQEEKASETDEIL